jgi:hypothetical protein
MRCSQKTCHNLVAFRMMCTALIGVAFFASVATTSRSSGPRSHFELFVAFERCIHRISPS